MSKSFLESSYVSVILVVLLASAFFIIGFTYGFNKRGQELTEYYEKRCMTTNETINVSWID